MIVTLHKGCPASDRAVLEFNPEDASFFCLRCGETISITEKEKLEPQVIPRGDIRQIAHR